MAQDFAELHQGKTREVLERSRAGRWFIENDRTDTLDFVATVGASDVVPEIKAGQLVSTSASQREP